MEHVAEWPKQRENGTSDIAVRTAEAIGGTVGYLRSHRVEEMINDAEEAAKRNPVPALISAATLGVLLGALLRRS